MLILIELFQRKFMDQSSLGTSSVVLTLKILNVVAAVVV